MAAPLLIELIDGAGDGIIDLLDRGEGLVGEDVMFEIAPRSLHVAEFGRLLGQPFDDQPWPLGEGGAGQLAAVDRVVVEDQDDRLRQSSEKRPVEPVAALQQGNLVGAALGAAAMNDPLVGGAIQRAEEAVVSGDPKHRCPQAPPIEWTAAMGQIAILLAVWVILR